MSLREVYDKLQVLAKSPSFLKKAGAAVGLALLGVLIYTKYFSLTRELEAAKLDRSLKRSKEANNQAATKVKDLTAEQAKKDEVLSAERARLAKLKKVEEALSRVKTRDTKAINTIDSWEDVDKIIK